METQEKDALVRATLVFVLRDGETLLGRKTKKIGKGLLNGAGGRIKPDEPTTDAAVREVKEEFGIDIRTEDLEKVAVVTFHNQPKDGVVSVWQVHMFITNYFTGVPKSSDEMLEPSWHNTQRLPFDEMLPADRFILPRIFKGETFLGEVWYGNGMLAIDGEVKITPLPIEELNRL